jgi:hypothetical protein
MFDDDKIEAIKESEIPRYFGDAASGSAYVLYYQAVDLDPASLGIKVPVPPTVPDVTIAGSPAHVTTPNGLSPLESPDLALPPGLGESSATSPAAEPIPHPPIPTAPSSPSLATLPLVNSVALLSQKKSLPSIRIPAPDSSTTSPTTSGRTHGGLFNTFRSSPSSSKTRPSTSDGTVSRSVGEDVLPPVPPVPFQYLNGKETKDHDKDKDKDKGEEKEKEREEERSSKEFDRKPSLWFKRRNAKLARDEREKEKEKEKDTKGVKDKDVGSAAPGHATTSATALSAAPSQSDAVPSVLGASSLWRRSSARVGYHVKRLSGGANSSTALGEADGTATATAPPTGGSLGSNSSPSHPPPHPRPHPHHSHSHPQPQPQPHQHQQQQQNHHHHHHHHREPPGRLPTVPATPQVVQSDWEPSTPSSTSSFPPATRSRSRHTQAQHSPPPLLLSNTDDDEPPPLPPLPVSGEEADVDSSSSLPGWRISPASLRGKSSGSATSSTSASAVLTHHHSGEPTSMVDDNDEGEEDDDDVASDDHEQEHEHRHGRRRLRAPAGLRFFAGRRRGRRHSLHGSRSRSGGSGSPHERSSSPQQDQGQQEVTVAAAVPSSQPASAPEPGGGTTFPSLLSANDGAPAPSSSASSSSTSAAAAGLRRAARKLSLNAPLFGLGLGLGLGLGGGRDKDRDPHHPHSHEHHHHLHFLGIGRKEESSQKAPA